MHTWDEAQKEEKDFWGDCSNTLGEELKQLVYAQHMELKFFHDGNSPWNIDLQGKSVLDIGGGPVSLLLKCKNKARYYETVVADPCDYPEWINERYGYADINRVTWSGEEIVDRLNPIPESGKFDEVWIYNCLQHTQDPEKIIKNAKKLGKTLRIFEWIDAETNHAHPIQLTEEKLNEWIGKKGNVRQINDNGAVGKAYYGVFNINDIGGGGGFMVKSIKIECSTCGKMVGAGHGHAGTSGDGGNGEARSR